MNCLCLSHNGFLTRAGYAVAASRRDSPYLSPLGVDGFTDLCYLDKVGSVSALAETETTLWLPEDLTDEQYRRDRYGS